MKFLNSVPSLARALHFHKQPKETTTGQPEPSESLDEVLSKLEKKVALAKARLNGCDCSKDEKEPVSCAYNALARWPINQWRHLSENIKAMRLEDQANTLRFILRDQSKGYTQIRTVYVPAP